MVEGISRVRYVIAVSRLTPHGASLLSRDDIYIISVAAVSFCFLFLVLWTAGSHFHQRLCSLERLHEDKTRGEQGLLRRRGEKMS